MLLKLFLLIIYTIFKIMTFTIVYTHVCFFQRLRTFFLGFLRTNNFSFLGQGVCIHCVGVHVFILVSAIAFYFIVSKKILSSKQTGWHTEVLWRCDFFDNITRIGHYIYIYAQCEENLRATRKERENYQTGGTYTHSFYFLFDISCVRMYIWRD